MTKVIASASAEGEIVIHRSDETEPKVCICCKGPHIFGRHVVLEGLVDYWGRPVTDSKWFVDDFACQKGPDKEPLYEGKRVRVTVEILDD
jgi:hypothetical protein